MSQNEINNISAESAEYSSSIYHATFGGLVDLVQNADGNVRYLVKDGTTLSVQESYNSGETVIPPPADKIPFLLPRADEVIKHYKKQTIGPAKKANQRLFTAVYSCFKKITDLSEEWYLFNSLWVMHTYLHDAFEYSPIVTMVADAESGKSRTGKGMTYLAYRGVHLETLRDAHIIRLADYYHASLFFDVQDINKKIESGQSKDIMLGRYEKGGRVFRVDKKSTAKYIDMINYSVFGPTIIASNEDIDHILDSRTIRIPIYPTSKVYDKDIIPADFLPLREQLTAFRARYMNTKLAEVKKMVAGRLGDIIRPIHQVLKLVAPAREKDLIELVQQIQNRRSNNRSLTLPAQLISVIDRLKSGGANGTLGVKTITEAYNLEKELYAKLTTQKIGRELDKLGFEKCRTNNGSAAILLNAKLIKKLKDKYFPSNDGIRE